MRVVSTQSCTSSKLGRTDEPSSGPGRDIAARALIEVDEPEVVGTSVARIARIQAEYHDDRFSSLRSVERVRSVIEDLSGTTTNEGWIGLDQMGHFGPHGCKLVSDAVAEHTRSVDVLLELGSGYGGSMRDVIDQLAKAGVPVRLGIGVEIVTGHIEAGSAIGRDFDVAAVAFVAGDVVRLPIASGGVDVVFAAGSMPHFYEPHDVIVEAARVLRPGGLLILLEEVSLVRAGYELRAEFLAEHPPNVFRYASHTDRTTALDEAGFADITFTDLTDWAVELTDARLRAARLLRGTAERVYGPAQVASIERTLAVAAEAFRERALQPGIFAAVRRPRRATTAR